MPIAGVPRVVRIIDLRHNSVVKITAGLAPTDDVRTRDAVARQILENGPSTAAALSKKLGFTPAGIRRHLDALVLDGVLEAREPHAASKLLQNLAPMTLLKKRPYQLLRNLIRVMRWLHF